jgi:hypothetical protein
MHKDCPAAIAEKNNKRNATFTGLHHKLWADYDPIIHSIYPFVLRKYALKKSVVRKIVTMRYKGVGMRAVEHLSGAGMEEHLMHADNSQILTITAAAENPITLGAVQRAAARGRIKLVSPVFKGTKYTRSVTRKVAADISKKEIDRLKGLWVAFTLLLSAVALCWDHTFWVAALASSYGDAKVKAFIALFSVVSEIGEILLFKYTRTKAHDELRKPLMKLRHNLDRNNARNTARATAAAAAVASTASRLAADGVVALSNVASVNVLADLTEAAAVGGSPASGVGAAVTVAATMPPLAVAAARVGSAGTDVAVAADRCIVQSSIRVVSTDAPLSDARLITDTFGPLTRVQMDRFHVFQIIYLHLKGFPERKILMATLRKHSFRLIEEDVRRKARQLIKARQRRIDGEVVTRVPGGQAGMPHQVNMSASEFEDKVIGFVKRHWRRYMGLRVSVFEPSKLANGWAKVVGEFKKTHPLLFKKTFDKMWSGMMKKIREGLLDDKVFPQLYVNIGTDENPDFLLARGSSQQEVSKYIGQVQSDRLTCLGQVTVYLLFLLMKHVVEQISVLTNQSIH